MDVAPDAQAFAALLGDVFTVVVGDGALVELTLDDVQRHGVNEGAPRAEPFSLLFSSPPSSTLAQATWTLQHGTLGDTAIFLVPIGPRPDGRMGYEAVFN